MSFLLKHKIPEQDIADAPLTDAPLFFLCHNFPLLDQPAATIIEVR